ncbi:MAG: serine--tRNA ligase [Alphaproteobacteria bacterium]|nr:serine--tRNA ligase [Alphaproteobacteria bacterium]
MHDIRFIREQPDAFDAALKRRNLAPAAKDIIALDAERRAAQTEMQELQAMRNEVSKQIGEVKRLQGKQGGEDAEPLMQKVAAMKERLASLEDMERLYGARLTEWLASLPNMPASDVPDGKDEHDNVELRRVGQPALINSPRQHFELGEAMGLMDFDIAAKLSGARFVVLKGHLARLERALGNFMIDTHTNEFGYTEISPPLLVKDEIMFGTAQLPKFADDQFTAARTKSRDELLREALAYAQVAEIENIGKGQHSLVDVVTSALSRAPAKEDLWLIPTAEVPLTNLVNSQIVEREELPLRFTAKTPCFRAEAGAAGKDTRGMLRQHQFYKVEMVSITAPDQSEAEHQRMTECAETILKRLELPFRTIVLCTGDMGFASRKTYDIEVWMPGQNTYREISSCSNCGDFQARRMNARLRTGEKQTEFVHTLNGSGTAVGRCMIAVMENYQQPDGSIIIPAALRPYMGGMERIG